MRASLERAGRATTATQAFRRHAALYVAVAFALIAANWFTGGSWWSFWPLAAWGALLGAHYLVYKARTVDEGWAEERAADLRTKSYDAAHIDKIAGEKKGSGPFSNGVGVTPRPTPDRDAQ